jgi:hypothetical protein
MTTAVWSVSHDEEIERLDLQSFLCRLEQDDHCLFQAEHLQERLVALDRLDAAFGGFDPEAFANRSNSRIRARAQALRTRLEAANAEFFLSVGSQIARGSQPGTLRQWIQNPVSENGSTTPLPGLGFDWRDELVSGILQFNEPSEPDPYRLPEMIPYQPTPVRHILHLIAASLLSKDDVFVDLGSGLGHVPLLLSLLAGVRSVGIEVQATYVASARECAERLRLSRARFVAEDARAADLSGGTVFYLYSPFVGLMLTDVLRMLRRESMRRIIKICSLGPCTNTIANETWLTPSSLPGTGSIAVFSSR